MNREQLLTFKLTDILNEINANIEHGERNMKDSSSKAMSGDSLIQRHQQLSSQIEEKSKSVSLGWLVG